MHKINHEEATLKEALSILKNRIDQGSISCYGEAKSYLQLKLALSPYEVFGVILIARNKRILSIDELFYGGAHNVQVDLRRLCAHVLSSAAASAILYHNHPGRSQHISEEDIAVTKSIRDALMPFGISVEDHFVVGDEIVSMKKYHRDIFQVKKL